MASLPDPVVHPRRSVRTGIGCALRPEVWGRGLATDVVTELLGIGDALDLSVWAETFAENIASRRVLENAGLDLVAEAPAEADVVLWSRRTFTRSLDRGQLERCLQNGQRRYWTGLDPDSGALVGCASLLADMPGEENSAGMLRPYPSECRRGSCGAHTPALERALQSVEVSVGVALLQ
ncbi:GNAT family N-acetyltransferase [Kocuria aegyptia]